MKLNASIKRLAGAENNAQNTLSFMEVQDGLLKTAGDIVTRISELKGLHSDDPLKSTANQTSYDTELTDLVAQLNDIAAATFNGESLFGTTAITLNYDEDATADITIAGSDFATAITDISSASSFDEGAGGLCSGNNRHRVGECGEFKGPEWKCSEPVAVHRRGTLFAEEQHDRGT